MKKEKLRISNRSRRPINDFTRKRESMKKSRIYNCESPIRVKKFATGGLPALERRRLLTPAKMRSGLAVTQAGLKML